MTHHGIAGVEAHGKRRGKVPNVNPSRTHLNEYLVGHDDLHEIVNARILEMQKENAARRVASLRKGRKTTDRKALEAAVEEAGDDVNKMAKAIGWPWDKKNTKPFTEGVISLSHDWFTDAAGGIDAERVERFKAFAADYLTEEFGPDLLYARIDLDEKTPHVHYVVAPELENPKTKLRELSRHSHRVFGQVEVQALFDGESEEDGIRRGSYELMQDRIAEHAESMGLDVQRGERCAQKERMQRVMGEEVIKRRNVSPARGREVAAQIAVEAQEDRDAAAEDRKAAGADLVAAGGARSDAEEERRQAEQTAEGSRQYARSLTVCTEAILDERLAYRPPRSEDDDEALTWGRNAPAAESARTALVEAIQPARAWLIGFARKVFGLKSREVEVEAAEKQLEKDQAEQRRQAAVIAAAERRAGKSVSHGLEGVASGAAPADYTCADFPEAWHIEPDARRETIDMKIDQADNRALRHAWAATLDAVAITEETDGALHRTFHHTVDEVERHAAARGFDLEKGTHDPRRATDRKRAELHKDQDRNPIRVIRRDKQRQRLRG